MGGKNILSTYISRQTQNPLGVLRPLVQLLRCVEEMKKGKKEKRVEQKEIRRE